MAVQGGHCIAHGAKKKVCSYEECTKQAILGGMCKKHYDLVNGVVKVRGGGKHKGSGAPQPNKGAGKGHQRGLSLFQDDDLMDTIINNGVAAQQGGSSGGTDAASAAAENDGLHGLSI